MSKTAFRDISLERRVGILAALDGFYRKGFGMLGVFYYYDDKVIRYSDLKKGFGYYDLDDHLRRLSKNKLIREVYDKKSNLGYKITNLGKNLLEEAGLNRDEIDKFMPE